MPRVHLLKKRYNERDLITWIYKRKRELNITLEDIAKALGTTRQTLHTRMRDENTEFTYPELMELFKRLEATDAEILHFMKT